MVTNIGFFLIYLESYKKSTFSCLVSLCVSKLLKIKEFQCFILIVTVFFHCLHIDLFYLFNLGHTKSDILIQNDISHAFMNVYFLIILSFEGIGFIAFFLSLVCGGWGTPRKILFFSSVKQYYWMTSVFSKSKEMSACGSWETQLRELFLLINLQLTLMVYFEEMGQIGEMSFLLFVFCSL